jgi:tripartite-type tricarboxylate transporter receptor subunit TctC
VLGVGSPKRVKELANSPAVSETVPGYEAGTWFGLATTGGTPRDVVMKINAEVRKILSDPTFHEKFMAPQLFESMAATPEEFSSYIKTETATWANVIREQKLVLE